MVQGEVVVVDVGVPLVGCYFLGAGVVAAFPKRSRRAKQRPPSSCPCAICSAAARGSWCLRHHRLDVKHGWGSVTLLTRASAGGQVFVAARVRKAVEERRIRLVVPRPVLQCCQMVIDGRWMVVTINIS